MLGHETLLHFFPLVKVFVKVYVVEQPEVDRTSPVGLGVGFAVGLGVGVGAGVGPEVLREQTENSKKDDK